MTTVHRHPTAKAFVSKADGWLRENLVENNIIASISRFLLSEKHHYEDPVFMATLEDEAQVAGCAVCVPPDGLYISGMTSSAVQALAASLEPIYPSIPQAIGPVDEAQAFAECWQKQNGNLHSIHQWFSMQTLHPPKRSAQGGLRLATEDDLATVQEWAPDYAREMDTKFDVAALFASMISRGLMYLWVDEVPCCLVTVSGLTPYSCRVSTLYTPPQHRGKGYAVNTVAESCKLSLDAGRSICIVSADVTASGPMHLYQQIGFRPAQKFAIVHFD